MDVEVLTTPQAAALLGIKTAALNHAIWSWHLPEPARCGRNFIFTWTDLERAAWHFRHKSIDDLLVQEVSV